MQGNLSADNRAINVVVPSFDSRLSGFFQVRVSINGGLQFSMTSQFSTFFAYSSWHRRNLEYDSSASAYQQSLPIDAGEGAHEPWGEGSHEKSNVCTDVAGAQRTSSKSKGFFHEEQSEKWIKFISVREETVKQANEDNGSPSIRIPHPFVRIANTESKQKK